MIVRRPGAQVAQDDQLFVSFDFPIAHAVQAPSFSVLPVNKVESMADADEYENPTGHPVLEVPNPTSRYMASQAVCPSVLM